MFILIGNQIYNLHQFISVRKEKKGVFGITNTGAKLPITTGPEETPETAERLFKEITYILDANRQGLYVIEI